MSDRPAVVVALEDLLAFLRRERVEWMLLGGMAVRVLALPRPTYDLDLMVAVDEEGVARFAEAAEAGGFVVPEEHRRGFMDRLQGLGKIAISVLVGTRPVRVDVFLTAPEYQKAAFARRTRHSTDLGELWLISPEDLLLHKLLADRPRDRADVQDLLLVHGAVDMGYVTPWARHLGVEDRLAKALQEAGRS